MQWKKLSKLENQVRNYDGGCDELWGYYSSKCGLRKRIPDFSCLIGGVYVETEVTKSAERITTWIQARLAGQQTMFGCSARTVQKTDMGFKSVVCAFIVGEECLMIRLINNRVTQNVVRDLLLQQHYTFVGVNLRQNVDILLGPQVNYQQLVPNFFDLNRQAAARGRHHSLHFNTKALMHTILGAIPGYPSYVDPRFDRLNPLDDAQASELSIDAYFFIRMHIVLLTWPLPQGAGPNGQNAHPENNGGPNGDV